MFVGKWVGKKNICRKDMWFGWKLVCLNFCAINQLNFYINLYTFGFFQPWPASNRAHECVIVCALWRIFSSIVASSWKGNCNEFQFFSISFLKHKRNLELRIEIHKASTLNSKKFRSLKRRSSLCESLVPRWKNALSMFVLKTVTIILLKQSSMIRSRRVFIAKLFLSLVDSYRTKMCGAPKFFIYFSVFLISATWIVYKMI